MRVIFEALPVSAHGVQLGQMERQAVDLQDAVILRACVAQLYDEGRSLVQVRPSYGPSGVGFRTTEVRTYPGDGSGGDLAAWLPMRADVPAQSITPSSAAIHALLADEDKMRELRAMGAER